MATLKIHDYANELRFEIVGKLSGDCVSEVSEQWMAALPGSYHRKLTIDITYLTGYDAAGRKLLRNMYEHGMEFSGSTPQSIAFLSDISSRTKSGGLTVIRESPDQPKPASSEQQPSARRLLHVQGSGRR